MPNVRGSKVRTFTDPDNLWPRAEEYATTHGLPSVSDVIRLALEQLLDGAQPDDDEPQRDITINHSKNGWQVRTDGRINGTYSTRETAEMVAARLKAIRNDDPHQEGQ